MKTNSISQLIFAAAGAFAAGLLVSWLVSPKSGAENREWLSKNTNGFKDKVKSSGKSIKAKNLPDLYEATEELGLTDDDVVTGNR